jgi:hypothetical protein
VLLLQDRSTNINFFHESVYEFFIARALGSDFKRVPKRTSSAWDPGGSALATVELDYPQSAIYGFLSEKLGAKYLHDLHSHLQQNDWRKLNEKLLRNLIEYLGMTYSDDPAVLVPLLLDLVEQHSNTDVRFNALGALERIDPGAPRPCGHGKKKPVPGRHWSWIPNGRQFPETKLKKSVSARLGRVLQSSLESPKDFGVRVNASHAWIRWLDEDDRHVLERVQP